MVVNFGHRQLLTDHKSKCYNTLPADSQRHFFRIDFRRI
jgi:hypothetical protein